MSHQLTFADSEFSSKRRQTRKEIFLSRMEQILPWQNMVEVIEPFYPKAGSGRRPYPLETMLRIHCMQHWYNLSDGAMEDALYEIASMRLFARLSLVSAAKSTYLPSLYCATFFAMGSSGTFQGSRASSFSRLSASPICAST